MEALKDFKGAAATIRFDDGGLELEMAVDSGATGTAVTAGDNAGAAVSALPDDTALAYGASFGKGWLTQLVDQFAQASGQSGDDLLAEMGDELGLDLPDDAETLVGDSLTLAVDADFDPQSLFEGSDTPSGVGVKVVGDAEDIEGVLAKLRTAAAGADGGLLDSDAGDGVEPPSARTPTTGRSCWRTVAWVTPTRSARSSSTPTTLRRSSTSTSTSWTTGWATPGSTTRSRTTCAAGRPRHELGADDGEVHAVIKVTTD